MTNVKIGVNRRAGDGNTKPPQPSKRKHYCFTWNNYKESDVVLLIGVLDKFCSKYCFQEELGDDKKTPHLQGTISLYTANRWTAFKLPDCIHWESTRNIDASYEYCQKEETRSGKIYKKGFPVDLKVLDKEKLHSWQLDLIKIIDDKVDDRTIHWIYDKDGNAGKTSLIKYLIKHKNIICATGGGNKDIANMLFNIQENGRDLNEKTTFIFSFGRSTEGISYKAIESVKDGLITNTKYESGTLCFNNPHVIVMSNDLPDIDKLTHDRWQIYIIKNNCLIDKTSVYV